MEYEQRLSPAQWGKIYAYLCTFPRLHTRHEDTCRRFVEAVLWVLRSGAPWRLLPQSSGNWNVVYQRFADWATRGVWYKMLYYCAQDPAMTVLMIDRTILRAHACAAGAQKKVRGPGRASLRPLPRRLFHQDSRPLRRSGTAHRFPPERGPRGGLYLCSPTAKGQKIRRAFGI